MRVAKNKAGFYIGVTCPGCGGELDLESDFFVLDCDHCGSIHRIKMPDVPPAFMAPARTNLREARFNIDRHLKKNSLPLTGSGLHIKQLYYPYWKIDAVLFRVRNRIESRMVAAETQHREEVTVESEKTEVSLAPYMTTLTAGSDLEGIPVSIGMRAEYIRVVPFTTDNQQDEFDPLPLTKPWEEVRKTLEKRTNSLGNIVQADFGKNHTELFHPRASLIYFPYFVIESYPGKDFNRFVVDAVTGRVVSHITVRPSADSFEYSEPVDYQPGELQVVPHRCGNCGVNLPEQQSFIYICDNCFQLEVLDEQAEIAGGIQVVKSEKVDDDRLFPFWSFGLPEEKARQLRPIFGGIFESDRLIVPAFKVQNFDALCRLAKRISAAYPRLEVEPAERFDGRYLPVSVSSGEALLLADLFIRREAYVPGLEYRNEPEAVVPTDIGLFYAPFRAQNYFFVDSVLEAVTFEKTLVE